MPRTKKVITTEISENESSSNSKKTRTRKVKVDGKTATMSKNKRSKSESNRSTRIRRSKSDIQKSYSDNGLFFEAPYIVFRMMNDTGSKDIIRNFICPVSIGKDKIGKMTKLPDGSKVKIVDIITNENDLVFVVDPVI